MGNFAGNLFLQLRELIRGKQRAKPRAPLLGALDFLITQQSVAPPDLFPSLQGGLEPGQVLLAVCNELFTGDDPYNLWSAHGFPLCEGLLDGAAQARLLCRAIMVPASQRDP